MLASLLRARTASSLATGRVNLASRLQNTSVFRPLSRPLSQSSSLFQRDQNSSSSYPDYPGGHDSYRSPRRHDRREREYERPSRPRRNVEPNPPNKILYVANFPYSTTESDVRDILAQFGTITQIRLGLNPDGTSRGYAHVEYLNIEEAVSAVENHAQEALWVHNRPLTLDYAIPRRARPQENSNEPPPPNKRLYYSQFAGNHNLLQNLLNQYREDLEGIFPLRGKQDAGFIAFKSLPVAVEALESLNGTQLEDGTTLQLSYAKPSEYRPRPRSRQFGSNSQNYES